MTITISNGEMRFVLRDELADLLTSGEARVRRASHVEPVARGLRWAFRLIRRRVADESRLAAWTRRWPCRWQVDLRPSGGPVFGAFRSRAEAIAAEVEWLERHVL